MNENITNLVGRFTCVATIDSITCGKEAATVNLPDLTFDLFLCEAHRAELYNRSDITYRAKEDDRAHRFRDKQSFVYIIQLADQTVKIGYTTRLSTRLMDISKQYNGGTPVKILTVLEGDQHLEGLLHWEWQDERIWDSFGERHYPTPDLMTWVNGLEATPLAKEDLAKFSKWQGTTPLEMEKKKEVKQLSREEEGRKLQLRLNARENRLKKKLEGRADRLSEYVAIAARGAKT